MATFSLELPKINTEDLKDSQNIKKISDFLFMLNDQLRYTLNNLSLEENFDKDTADVFNKIAKEITLTVKKGELSAELSLENGVITLSGNRVIIDSEKFKVTQDGKIKAVDGEFQGTITGTGIQSYAAGIGYSQLYGGMLLSFGGPAGTTAKLYDGILECKLSDYLWTKTSYYQYEAQTGAGHFTIINGQTGILDNAQIMTSANVNGYVTHPESDYRLKKDVIIAPGKWLDVLKDVRVKEFTFKDNTVWGDKGQRHLGVIAQQLDKTLEKHDAKETGLVFKRPKLKTQNLDVDKYIPNEDPLAVDYNQFIPMLIMGYQRQQEQIEKQQEQIEALKKEIEILKGGKEQ